MKKFYVVMSLVVLAAVALLAWRRPAAVAASQAPPRELPPLQLIQRIPVPGVTGRIDHFTAFPKRRLLIFAALGNNSMEIVNTFEAKVVQSTKGLDEPQGVLYVPGLDKIFVANAGNGTVKVYDGKTYALRKSIALGEEADTDNLRWDEDSKRVFVGIVGGIAMIDAVTEAMWERISRVVVVTPNRSNWKSRGLAFSSTFQTTGVWSMLSTGRQGS